MTIADDRLPSNVTASRPTHGVVGIDFGGTAIKAAAVDIASGRLMCPPAHVETPRPATPERVCDVIERLVSTFTDVDAAVGLAVPGVVRNGVLHSAANIDHGWVGVDAEALLAQKLGRPVHVTNDADAAGLAEVHFGAARPSVAGDASSGLVLVTTLGTGIGSALIYRGVLVPNTELGHVELDGYVAEKRAATSIREREQLSYEEWAKRLTRYFRHLERLFAPDLIVVGGGVSQSWSRFGHLIEVDAPIRPAELANRACIVGASLVASDPSNSRWKLGRGHE